MKWQGRRESDNVTKFSGGDSLGRGGMLGELGITGRLIVVVILLLLGQNSLSLLENITGTGQTDTIQLETYTPRNKEEAELEKLLHLIV
ncbi:neutral zinc metallopeptidase [Helcococcus ovis]|uniref:neutral zinc metallopeptidase n=1 Tax=Helcococcus ovis TaxID=72026 RepID=UPI0038BCD4BC